jgi:iron complex transport system substrate-binding protein
LARTSRGVPRIFSLFCVSLSLLCVSCAGTTGHIASTVPPSQRRVIALIPSFVEDLCAIGATRQLVGVSSATSDVPCARGVPQVGTFSSVDTEKVVALHPDVVVAIPSQGRLVELVRRAGIKIVTMRDDTFDDLFADIAQLGDLTGRRARADVLIASLRARTNALRARGRALKHRPSVFVALGTGPIWTVGPQSYIATLIGLAGGRDAVEQLPSAYADYSAEALLRLQPDAIVSDPAVGLRSVLDSEPWRSLRAVQQRRVYIISNASLLERPGPRYNEGLEWLVERLTSAANAR